MTDNLEELERLLDRTGKCLDHPKLQVSDRDARALRDRLIATAREVEGLRAEVARYRETLGTIAAGDVPISVWPDLAVRYEKFARAALEGRGSEGAADPVLQPDAVQASLGDQEADCRHPPRRKERR